MLKRQLLLLLISISFLVLMVGCKAGNNHTDDKDWANDLEDTQKIEIRSSEHAKPVSIINDNQEITAFVKELKLDKWEIKGVPSNATKAKEIKFYHLDTIKLSESSEGKKTLEQVATVSTYKDIPYLDLTLKSITLSFKVPKDVSFFLSEYK